MGSGQRDRSGPSLPPPWLLLPDRRGERRAAAGAVVGGHRQRGYPTTGRASGCITATASSTTRWAYGSARSAPIYSPYSFVSSRSSAVQKADRRSFILRDCLSSQCGNQGACNSEDASL